MRNYSVFDIMGPIMIGPSSSHTAGAVKLGKIAGIIAGEDIIDVKFMLHGSFAQTYKGHGTDKALVAGILGMDPWDDRLKTSIEIAKAKGINISFIGTDMGDVHPNTVKFIITKDNGEISEITGSSIGGGTIAITEIDGEQAEFTGVYPTLVINHIDVPGMILNVCQVFYNHGVNIAVAKIYRNGKGSNAAMVFEVDSYISKDMVGDIKKIPHINKVKAINL